MMADQKTADGRAPCKENPLAEVIERLLDAEGCPWDRKQSPLTLCDYLIEEAFELVEAVRAYPGSSRSAVEIEVDGPSGPTNGTAERMEVVEELGDVLFLLYFMAKLYDNNKDFGLADAFEASAAKMIRRHPHVFSDKKFENSNELLVEWERIKRAEKADDCNKGIYESLPKGLPPMLKAYRIHAKAARIGFTWESSEEVEEQLESEWAEWEGAAARKDPDKMEEEFGDYLFTLIEYGRRKGIKANAALDKANAKFLARFEKMEALARERGLDLPELSLEEQNALWDEVKGEEH
jgi:ATP diphosphatase